jgi:hypothetical protein
MNVVNEIDPLPRAPDLAPRTHVDWQVIVTPRFDGNWQIVGVQADLPQAGR